MKQQEVTPNHEGASFVCCKKPAELIKTLVNSANSQSYQPVVSMAGRYGGTFVCKEIAYAYAMFLAEDVPAIFADGRQDLARDPLAEALGLGLVRPDDKRVQAGLAEDRHPVRRAVKETEKFSFSSA